MRHFMFAGTIALAAMAVAGAGAQAPSATQNNMAEGATQRLNREASERLRRQLEERQRVEAANRAAQENNARIDQDNARRQREYEEQLRAREAANAAEQARYDAEMARYRAEQTNRERQTARSGNRSSGEARANASRTTGDRTRTASAATPGCADQLRRNRQRGRTVGGLVGGVAGLVGGRQLGSAARTVVAVAAVPVGALIGDAIASRLDCREQEQAAQATEQAVAGGVGTTVSWRSETRENVSGTSTVTALEAPPVPGTPVAIASGPLAATPGAGPVASASAETSPCLTVTDVIIVDGEETRAPKRMCRRPPSNRYIRV